MNADASSDSSLRERIQDDIKAAMRAREKERLLILRLISSEIKQREVDERITLNDADVVAVLDKMTKQRKDSLEQYQKAGRDDLATQEAYELTLIEAYLPARVSDEELAQILDQAFADVAPSSMKDMGKLMGIVKPQLQGRADMGAVSKQVRERLTSL